jgi:hypothetical protein
MSNQVIQSSKSSKSYKTTKRKNKTKTNKTKNKNTKKQNQFGGNKWEYIPLKIVNALEPLAEYYNVSHKARGLQKPTKSDKGFLTVYREAKGNPSKFESMPVRQNKPDGEKWAHHREDFCNRRYAMIKGKLSPGYGLYDSTTGLPSVMHVNMLMWACSPDAANIKKKWKSILANLAELKTKSKN